MNQTRKPLLALALTALLSAPALAQPPSSNSTTLPPTTMADSSTILQEMPKVPVLPASLFAPAPPTGTVSGNLWEEPYFTKDPILDPSQFSQPGWFTNLELGVMKPHFKDGLNSPVQNSSQLANGTSTNVAIPSAPLDWTLTPKVSVGYQLPAGYGDLIVAFRGTSSSGNQNILGLDGPALIRSRLNYNILDLDYASKEFAFILWPQWEMKWTVGARILWLYLDSQFNQPINQAAAGSGIASLQETNSLFAVGPHAGLEMSRKIGDTGFSVLGRLDFTTDLGKITQGYSALSTNGSGGPLLWALNRSHDGTDVPILNLQLGLNWTSPSNPGFSLFAGYEYEYWWSVGSLINGSSSGDLANQGFVLQAVLHF